MFSFVDSMSHAIADAGATEFPRESAVEPTHSWPLVLITNPKSSAYLSPLEPWSRIATSTHVRMLIFHPQPDAISSVRVSITHPSSGRVEMPPRFALRGVCDSTWWRQSRGNWPSYTDALAATLCPLFVAPWRPASLSRGALLLHVEIALHNDSRVYRRTHDFSIDGALTAMPVSFRAEDEAGSAMRPSLARACLAIIGRSFLHSDFAAALPLCCLVAWLAVVVPFLLAPFASKYCFNRQDCVSVPSALQPPAPLPARVRRSCGVSQIADAIERGLAACHRCITHAVHAHSRSSALLFAWAVYIVFGPLAWGTFVGDREALMFAWGFYFLDDSHLVALLHSDTLFYLFRRIVFSLLPVCIFLSVSSAIELSEALPGRTARRQLVWLVASRACMALCLFWYLHAELHSARLLVSMYSWRVAAFSPGMLGFSALGGSVMALRLVSLCRTPQTVRV